MIIEYYFLAEIFWVQWSPRGEMLATTNSDYRAKLVEFTTGKELYTLNTSERGKFYFADIYSYSFTYSVIRRLSTLFERNLNLKKFIRKESTDKTHEKKLMIKINTWLKLILRCPKNIYITVTLTSLHNFMVRPWIWRKILGTTINLFRSNEWASDSCPKQWKQR